MQYFLIYQKIYISWVWQILIRQKKDFKGLFILPALKKIEHVSSSSEHHFPFPCFLFFLCPHNIEYSQPWNEGKQTEAAPGVTEQMAFSRNGIWTWILFQFRWSAQKHKYKFKFCLLYVFSLFHPYPSFINNFFTAGPLPPLRIAEYITFLVYRARVPLS